MKITLPLRRFCPRPRTLPPLRPRSDGKPRGPGKRLPDELAAVEEGRLSDPQLEFVTAISVYKKANRRPFPTWTEVLEVLRQLGYRKVLPRAIPLDAPEPPLE